jgi:hypothetical protein
MRVNARIVASDSVCRCRLNRRFDEGKVPKVSFDFHIAVPPERDTLKSKTSEHNKRLEARPSVAGTPASFMPLERVTASHPAR